MSKSKSHLLYSRFTILIFPLLPLFAPTAAAYPDLIRKGYTSCVSCHVSPNGSGALTGYGRGFSEELFTISWEGAGSVLGLSALDEWKDPTGLFSQVKADFGADWRSVTFQQMQTEVPQERQTIPMQLDGHLAVHIGKTTDLVIGYGQYGPEGSMESRTHYGQFRLSRYLSLRGGRFLPAYGLNIDDHTAFIRSGLGFSQGREALALEAHFETESLMLTMTRVFGETVNIMESNRSWTFNSETREGLALRSGVKLGTQYLVGASLYHDQTRDVGGIFLSAAPIKKWLYVLAEADYERRKVEDGPSTAKKVGFLRIGSEVYRGIVLGLDAQIENTEASKRQRYSLWFQFMPLPHLELRVEGRREETGVTTALLMSHVWL